MHSLKIDTYGVHFHPQKIQFESLKKWDILWVTEQTHTYFIVLADQVHIYDAGHYRKSFHDYHQILLAIKEEFNYDRLVFNRTFGIQKDPYQCKAIAVNTLWSIGEQKQLQLNKHPKLEAYRLNTLTVETWEQFYITFNGVYNL